MIRMTRILLLAVVCGLPSLAQAQEFPAEEQQQPAPGEPGGAATDAADEIERFDRSVSPIEGTKPTDDTQLGEATDVPPATAGGEVPAGNSGETTDAPDGAAGDEKPVAPGEPTGALAQPDVLAELQVLRQEIDKRLIAMERRIDEQTARIEALTANSPVERSEEMKKAASARDAELAQVKQELEQLRSQIAGQLAGVANAGEGETTTAARPVTGGDAYRLRIHNTTGVEQPISINGVQWTVRADEWSSVPIPRGPVTVNRPGQQSLAVAGEQIDWQSDKRGYFFDYNLDSHQVAQPAAE